MDTDLILLGEIIPLVSIIIVTFNRAHIILRALESVLSQTYKNIEVVIIDDGSTDNTQEILKSQNDSRIRVYKHEKNKGVTAAKNSGLDQIRGEWFTLLDSDDEMKPEAIETMIKIPLRIDKTVTAVTCNCWDTGMNDFSGSGLKESQYLDVKTLMTVCKGIFWGITKTELLQNDRFNKNLNGYEGTLWYKINDRVKRYYVHKALSIIHTEGEDRITNGKKKYDLKRKISDYENILTEKYYLNVVKRYRPSEYYQICKIGLVTMKANKNDSCAYEYYKLLRAEKKDSIVYLIYKFRIISLMINQYTRVKSFGKAYLYRLIKK